MDNIKDYRLSKLRELQLEEIKLIKIFIDICEKEHLMYYMICGTLLGAIRHKGFIPWDDDVDIGMPRPDYERFLCIAEKYIPQYISMVTFGRPVWYALDHRSYITKLENVQHQVECTGYKNRYIRGAWIDIFPLDGMPNNIVSHKIHQARLLFLRKLYGISNFKEMVALENPHRSWYNRIGVSICSRIPIQRLFSVEKRWRAMDKALKKYPYDSSEYLVNMMGAYKFKEMFRREVFGEGAFYEFEGMQLRGPKDYDFYLTQLYGDYMTPPPEAERNWHGTEFLENDIGEPE